jgi:dTDP-glucose pyrophosphorylase
MKELTFSKELLPLFDGRPVIQHSIDAMRKATSHLRAAVHPQKKDLARYLKNQGVEVLIETHPYGLPSSIAFAAQSHPGPILFALPDTYYEPVSIFLKLKHSPHENVIGLFESGTPERFDSVTLKSDLITRYAVKVDPPLSPLTMGCGKLSPNALALFNHITIKPSNHSELIFGSLIQPLVKSGHLFGLTFNHSRFFDLGTPSHYFEYLLHRFPLKAS